MSIEYSFLIAFIIISGFLSFVIFALSYLLAEQKYDSQKLSAYECGFQPFEDTKSKFNIKFYLVAILFIIFDLEVVFLFPWALNLGNYSYLEMMTVLFFLIILTVGFIYEWLEGALDWD